MHLEVHVVRRPLSVAGVAEEAEHVTGAHDRAVHRERRVRGEVRVVELVARVVPEPETPAADAVPADCEHRAVRDREQRRAERGEDVVAVMPATRDIATECAEGVDERRVAVDGKHVAAGAEFRRHVGRPAEQRRQAVRIRLAGKRPGGGR